MQSQPNEENPEETVTEESLMQKFKKIRGIKELLQKGILLYVVLLDGDTPKWVKAIALQNRLSIFTRMPDTDYCNFALRDLVTYFILPNKKPPNFFRLKVK